MIRALNEGPNHLFCLVSSALVTSEQNKALILNPEKICILEKAQFIYVFIQLRTHIHRR